MENHPNVPDCSGLAALEAERDTILKGHKVRKHSVEGFPLPTAGGWRAGQDHAIPSALRSRESSGPPPSSCLPRGIYARPSPPVLTPSLPRSHLTCHPDHLKSPLDTPGPHVRPAPPGPGPRPYSRDANLNPPAPPGLGPGLTHGMPISNKLFWMSCLPSMMMLSWIQSSIRQPPGAHCGTESKCIRPPPLPPSWTPGQMTAALVLWVECGLHKDTSPSQPPEPQNMAFVGKGSL